MIRLMDYICIIYFFKQIELDHISQNDEQKLIFDAVSHYINQNSPENNEIYINSGCPSGSKVYGKPSEKKCINCGFGEMSESSNGNKCNKCLPDFEMVQKDPVECKQCPFGQLYIRNIENSNINECRDPKCDIDEFHDFDSNKCKICSEKIENSIGRSENTLPLIEYCLCPNKSIRLRFKDNKVTCTSDNHIIDFVGNKINDAKESFNFLIFDTNSTSHVSAMICKPFEKRTILKDNFCICDEGFIYKDGICESCYDLRMTGEKIKECLCPEGNEIRKEKCTKCPKGYFKGSISDNLCSKCNYFFTTKNTGSINAKDCSDILNANVIIVFSVILVIIILVMVLVLYFSISKRKYSSRNNSKNVYEAANFEYASYFN
ncbi:MAG: calcium ion binding [Paramarteilia canceri]